MVVNSQGSGLSSGQAKLWPWSYWVHCLRCASDAELDKVTDKAYTQSASSNMAWTTATGQIVDVFKSNGRTSPVAHSIRLRRIVLRCIGRRRCVPAGFADDALHHSRGSLLRQIVAAPRSVAAVSPGLRADAPRLARTGRHSTARQNGRGYRMRVRLWGILVWHTTDSHARSRRCGIDAHRPCLRFLQTVVVARRVDEL